MACAEALADVIQFETSDNVAFFVAEPVMGEGGIIMTTLKEVSPKQVAIDDIRGKGLMIGIEIVKEMPTAKNRQQPRPPKSARPCETKECCLAWAVLTAMCCESSRR